MFQKNVVKALVALSFLIVMFVARPLPANAAPVKDEPPQVVVQGNLDAGQTVVITVLSPYNYWELYFATTGKILEAPADCSINTVGGANCQPGNEHVFTVEVPISESHQMWVLARTSFGSIILDNEQYIEIGVGDHFRVRPGEVSEYLYYLGNDSLKGQWNGTGVNPSDNPVTYTLPTPGAIQLQYPETGTYTFTYWVSTEVGPASGMIFVEVTPDAPPSRFPDVVDDYIELTEGQTSQWIGFLANDKIVDQENMTMGIETASLPFSYTSPTIGAIQFFAPVAGTYTLTYYVNIWGVGQDEAHIFITVNPVVEEPTALDPATQPIDTRVWLPLMAAQG